MDPIVTAMQAAGLTPGRLEELRESLAKSARGEAPGRFARLTQSVGGEPVHVRKDMVAVVGRFNGKTTIVLENEDVAYEVKESPEQVLRLIGEPNGIQDTKGVPVRPGGDGARPALPPQRGGERRGDRRNDDARARRGDAQRAPARLGRLDQRPGREPRHEGAPAVHRERAQDAGPRGAAGELELPAEDAGREAAQVPAAGGPVP